MQAMDALGVEDEVGKRQFEKRLDLRARPVMARDTVKAAHGNLCRAGGRKGAVIHGREDGDARLQMQAWRGAGAARWRRRKRFLSHSEAPPHGDPGIQEPYVKAPGFRVRARARPAMTEWIGNAPYSAATRASTRSTRAAQYLNSGIFPNGSSAGLVRRLAAAST